MARPPKATDEIDWELASDHLAEVFPGLALSQIADLADAAAERLACAGSKRQAQALRRAAKLIRARSMH